MFWRKILDTLAGQLRSLHQFLDAAPHDIAVRIFSGPFHLEENTTPGGKRYRLLSMPSYLVHRIFDYLDHYCFQG